MKRNPRGACVARSRCNRWRAAAKTYDHADTRPSRDMRRGALPAPPWANDGSALTSHPGVAEGAEAGGEGRRPDGAGRATAKPAAKEKPANVDVGCRDERIRSDGSASEGTRLETQLCVPRGGSMKGRWGNWDGHVRAVTVSRAGGSPSRSTASLTSREHVNTARQESMWIDLPPGPARRDHRGAALLRARPGAVICSTSTAISMDVRAGGRARPPTSRALKTVWTNPSTTRLRCTAARRQRRLA